MLPDAEMDRDPPPVLDPTYSCYNVYEYMYSYLQLSSQFIYGNTISCKRTGSHICRIHSCPGVGGTTQCFLACVTNVAHVKNKHDYSIKFAPVEAENTIRNRKDKA